MAKRNYGNNDFKEFLAGAWDEDYLKELQDDYYDIKQHPRHLVGSRSPNPQYEIIPQSGLTIIIDNFNDKSKIFVTEKAEPVFEDILENKITALCEGFPYEAWKSIQRMSEDDD